MLMGMPSKAVFRLGMTMIVLSLYLVPVARGVSIDGQIKWIQEKWDKKWDGKWDAEWKDKGTRKWLNDDQYQTASFPITLDGNREAKVLIVRHMASRSPTIVLQANGSVQHYDCWGKGGRVGIVKLEGDKEDVVCDVFMPMNHGYEGWNISILNPRVGQMVSIDYSCPGGDKKRAQRKMSDNVNDPRFNLEKEFLKNWAISEGYPFEEQPKAGTESK
jgi:hypothetical protein